MDYAEEKSDQLLSREFFTSKTSTLNTTVIFHTNDFLLTSNFKIGVKNLRKKYIILRYSH